MASSSMSGSCLRDACTSPVGSSTFQSSGMHKMMRCVPSVAVKRTTGYSRRSFMISPSRLNALIFLLELPSASISSSKPAACSFIAQFSKVASPMNPMTLPREPLTRVSSIFFISMTWAPFFRSMDLGAIIFDSSLSRIFGSPESCAS
ncbi:hypothetical protein F5Y19DRAFT_468798 [Xylariaceae sp. FL1651]|nr:hypothetical protein F5Y19DRAFT_468798 [Xylariaceae sp. FL1651]